MRARIAAQQLLHRFVLDADSFLSDLRKIVYSGLWQPHVCYRRRTRVGTNRTAADSAAADLILSHSVRLGAKDARTAREFLHPRIHEISTGEIMKYLLLIAAIMTLTSATTISSSDAGCCDGGACCPGACCMTMTR